MSRVLKKFNHSSLRLALAAVLAVLVWRVVVMLHRGWHLQQMADELGSVGRLESADPDWYANRHFSPNHQNTAIVYAQYTATGLGLFYRNLAGGKTTLVCEQPERGWSWQVFGMMGWSPDDRLFACALPNPDPRQSQEEILIVDGTSGEVVKRLGAAAQFNRLTWLSPHAFVYSYWDGDNCDLNVIEQNADNTWAQTHGFKQLGRGPGGLAATSPNTVVWEDGPDLWMLDFTSGTPRKIWASTTTNQLQGFNYVDQTGDFNLYCTNQTGWVTIGFRPPSSSLSEGVVLDNPAAPDETADLRSEGGLNRFYLQARGRTNTTQLAWPGHIMSYRINGNSLYIAGDLTNEMAGIWRYNFDSGDCDRVVSASDHPLKHARLVGAQFGALTNADGRQLPYLIWQPTRFDARKKYPLIIGQTCYFQWMPYPQVAANAGSYFMLVTRPSWFDGLPDWSADVMRAHDLMVKNPNVDTNRIYLYGVSAEGAYLSQLLADQPTLWRGAIYFVPEVVSIPSNLGISRMLIIDGTDDGVATNSLTKSADEAALSGISVNLSLVPGAAHVFRSTASERESDRQLARFISGD